jgi:hypothetical protein
MNKPTQSLNEPDDSNKRERLSLQNPEMVFMDGFDNCLIGTTMVKGTVVACYDVALVIKQHMADGMTEDEAWEFFEFNQLGSCNDENSPTFLVRDAG